MIVFFIIVGWLLLGITNIILPFFLPDNKIPLDGYKHKIIRFLYISFSNNFVNDNIILIALGPIGFAVFILAFIAELLFPIFHRIGTTFESLSEEKIN